MISTLQQPGHPNNKDTTRTITPQQQRQANACARKCGHGRATTVILDSDISEPKLISHVAYGYRKNTTGEYVPNAYRNNFGWKNTYYQHAETTVAIPICN